MSVARYLSELAAGTAEVHLIPAGGALGAAGDAAFDAFAGRAQHVDPGMMIAILVVHGRDVERMHVTADEVQRLTAAGATPR